MQSLFKLFFLFAALTFSFTSNIVRAQDDTTDSQDQGVSLQTFYDQLGPDQGTWIQTDDYGYVFQPNVTDPNWAPYTDGHWVYTDEGWTWASDEPWGWATYHYGRWANIDDVGWVWVPGYQWAPAWVSWRYGNGYAGWAPLPPESMVGSDYSDSDSSQGDDFSYGSDVDVDFHIGAGCYNFVPVDDLGAPNCGPVIVNRYTNYGIINGTTNITNIHYNRNGTGPNGGSANNFNNVSAGGPPLNEVNAHARQPIQTVQLTAANQPGVSTQQGNSLAVFAPRINPATAHQARPAAIAQTIAHPTFNRGDSIAKPLAVTASVRPAAPTAEAISSAQKAQASAPAQAHVVTATTPMKSTLSRPLTSLTPVAHTPVKTSAAPTIEHTTAEAPPTQAFHPQSEPAPQPQPQVAPAQAFHPQTEPAPQPQRYMPPTQTYAPQNQAAPQPQHEAPAPSFHPQSEPAPQPQHEAPAPAFHPQEQAPAQHEAPPAEAFHPSAPSAPAPASHAAPAQPNHSAPAGPGGKPAPGKDDGKKNPDDNQGH